MNKVWHVFTFDFLDSLLIFLWLAMFTLATLAMAFPIVINQDTVQLYGISAFFLLTTGRFVANCGHNPWAEMPVVYFIVVLVYYFALGHYTFEWFLSLAPTCIACAVWPGIVYLAKHVKPVAVVSDRTFITERIKTAQPLQRGWAQLK